MDMRSATAEISSLRHASTYTVGRRIGAGLTTSNVPLRPGATTGRAAVWVTVQTRSEVIMSAMIDHPFCQIRIDSK
jgi:hypothetical protein